jgi:hypothetical protein
MATKATTPVETGLRERFLDLENRLSPENLSSDGEASRTEQRRRLAAIRRAWKDLEAQAGRKVSHDEVDQWWREKHLEPERREVPRA